MPSPDDELKFEDSNLPDDIPLEPLLEVEMPGETAPQSETTEDSTPATLDEGDQKAEKKTKRKKKAKKVKDSEKAPDEEEQIGKDEGEKQPGLFQRLTEASPYTVMLGMAVVFLFIAVLVLFNEWRRYHFDTKAMEYKERVSWRAPVVESETDFVRG